MKSSTLIEKEKSYVIRETEFRKFLVKVSVNSEKEFS